MTVTFSELATSQLGGLELEESALEGKLLKVLNGLSKGKDFSVYTNVGGKNIKLRIRPTGDDYEVLSAVQ